MKDPSNGRCGHVFCRQCVLDIFEKRSEKDCPVCRTTIRNDQIFPNLIARQLVGQLRVLCPYAVTANSKTEAEAVTQKAGGKDEHDSFCTCTWRGVVDDLKDHMKVCALRPRGVTSDSKFSRVPHAVISYHATSDVRGGGTGGEFVNNLGNAGQQSWNKWFGHDDENITITLTFAVPFKVHRYLLQSANDCIGRSPRSWDLFGISANQSADHRERVLLHSVQEDLFQSHWETKEYIVSDPSDTLFRAVELKIKNTKAKGQGCQLGSFFLFHATDNDDNDGPPTQTQTQWTVRSSTRNGSVNFISKVNDANMFHFNPRTSERQIVMNTCSSNWGREERIELPTISPHFPIPLEAFIRVTSVGYEVYFDGNLRYTYHHRLPWSDFKTLKKDDSWQVEI